jgi:uncharacterized membrane protein (DUF4010 family)
MDAITLSTSRLVDQEQLAPQIAWRAIVIASMSNIVFKTGVVASLGGRRLTMGMLGVALVKLAAGGAILIWWR